MASSPADPSPLKHTPLHGLHVELNAKMVPFAGYAMPVQYAKGILAEHRATREAAGLFDVSHMGQASLHADSFEAAAAALEMLVPGAIAGLKPGRMRYTVLLNDDGGIMDDLMITRPPEGEAGQILLVVNAACKDEDFAHMDARLPAGVRLVRHDDKALLALQGPLAAEVLGRHCPVAQKLSFMTGQRTEVGGMSAFVSRSGYTGEDGYEISVAADEAAPLARLLLGEEEVTPVGLGARDSLRLEAGLCLYGHDLDTTTSPVEGAIEFAMGKKRREAGGFPGHARIAKELADGASRRRVGLVIEDRAPAREGAPILDPDGSEIGKVTSGTLGPSFGKPIAMGYVAPGHAAPGTRLGVSVRGRTLPAVVTEMPFVPHRYVRTVS